MGAIKPLIRLGGVPILTRVLETLHSSRLEEVVVVLGHDAERIQAEVAMDRETVVLNREHAEGMSASLRAGLRALDLKAEACLVVLADQPFLQSKTIDTLIDAFVRVPAAILVPTYRGRRGNPVLLRRGMWPEVGTLTGDLGFRAVFSKHSKDLREVPVEDPGILIDMDTPADLERIRQALAEKLPLDSLIRPNADRPPC